MPVPLPRAKGGLIYASKGMLVNYQPQGTDTVPAMLTPGEFVVNKDATQKNLGLLRSINSGSKTYSKGGVVYAASGGEILQKYKDIVAKFEKDFAEGKISGREYYKYKPKSLEEYLVRSGEEYSTKERQAARRAEANEATRRARVRDRDSRRALPSDAPISEETRSRFGVGDLADRFNAPPTPERGGVKKTEYNRLGRKIYYNDGTTEQLLERDETSNQNQALEALSGPVIGKGISLGRKLLGGAVSRFLPKSVSNILNKPLRIRRPRPASAPIQDADSFTPDTYRWLRDLDRPVTGSGNIPRNPSPVASSKPGLIGFSDEIDTIIANYRKKGLSIDEAWAVVNGRASLISKHGAEILVDSSGRSIRVIKLSESIPSVTPKISPADQARAVEETARRIRANKAVQASKPTTQPKPNQRIDLDQGIQPDPAGFRRSRNKGAGGGKAVPSRPTPGIGQQIAGAGVIGATVAGGVYLISETTNRGIVPDSVTEYQRKPKAVSAEPTLEKPKPKPKPKPQSYGPDPMGREGNPSGRRPEDSGSDLDINTPIFTSIASDLTYAQYKEALIKLDKELKSPPALFYTTDWSTNPTDPNFKYYRRMQEHILYKYRDQTSTNEEYTRLILNKRAMILREYEARKAYILKRLSETASPFDPEYKPQTPDAKPSMNADPIRDDVPKPKTTTQNNRDRRAEPKPRPVSARARRKNEEERLQKATIDPNITNSERTVVEAQFKKHLAAINAQINIPISKRIQYLQALMPRINSPDAWNELNSQVNTLSRLIIQPSTVRAAYGLDQVLDSEWRTPLVIPNKQAVIDAQKTIVEQVQAARKFLSLSNSRLEYLQTGMPVRKPQNKSRGGIIYASKGMMVPYEPRGTDTVPAMLTPGEFVVNREATQKNLGLLQSINKSRGGVVYAQNGRQIPNMQHQQKIDSRFRDLTGAASSRSAPSLDDPSKTIQKQPQQNDTEVDIRSGLLGVYNKLLPYVKNKVNFLMGFHKKFGIQRAFYNPSLPKGTAMASHIGGGNTILHFSEEKPPQSVMEHEIVHSVQAFFKDPTLGDIGKNQIVGIGGSEAMRMQMFQSNQLPPNVMKFLDDPKGWPLIHSLYGEQFLLQSEHPDQYKGPRLGSLYTSSIIKQLPFEALPSFIQVEEFMNTLDSNKYAYTKQQLRLAKSELMNAINFSKGGIVYASKGQLINYQPRGTDTIPAMLTPGEFVVNREATQQNLGLLQAINKSRGGVVYASNGVEVGAGGNSSYGSTGAATVNFSIPQDVKDQLAALCRIKLDPEALVSLNAFKTDFTNILSSLQQIKIHIPEKVEMVGFHNVAVTIDAPALENMIPGIQSMIASSVSLQMESIWNQSGGELGPRPSMV